MALRRSLLSLARLSAPLLLALLLAPGAMALNHGTFVGTDVTFNDVTETSSTDPVPLFGAPITAGNQLLFFPTTFSANAGGAGGFDQTSALLSTTIEANGPLDTITSLNIHEFGDATLSGIGDATTGTFANLSGFVTILEVSFLPVAPIIIPFAGTFNPADTLNLPGDAGLTLWSAHASVDILAALANVTKVQLQMDNDLFASSQAGTGATIQKKVVSGPAVIIEVVPEPGTALLLGGGLAALTLRRRRGRA